MSLARLFKWAKGLSGADVARLTSITKTLIDLINEHGKNQLKPRKRRPGKGFPLWVALRGANSPASKINKVLAGFVSYPYASQAIPKEVFAAKILRNKSITSLQFSLINGYLGTRGYYNNHWGSRNIEPPETVIPIGSGGRHGKESMTNHEIDVWFAGVLEKIDEPISLRAILDDRVTDLILMKALDIVAFRANEHQKKRKGLHLVSVDEAIKRLYPEKNWMYSGA